MFLKMYFCNFINVTLTLLSPAARFVGSDLNFGSDPTEFQATVRREQLSRSSDSRRKPRQSSRMKQSKVSKNTRNPWDVSSGFLAYHHGGGSLYILQSVRVEVHQELPHTRPDGGEGEAYLHFLPREDFSSEKKSQHFVTD